MKTLIMKHLQKMGDFYLPFICFILLWKILFLEFNEGERSQVPKQNKRILSAVEDIVILIYNFRCSYPTLHHSWVVSSDFFIWWPLMELYFSLLLKKPSQTQNAFYFLINSLSFHLYDVAFHTCALPPSATQVGVTHGSLVTVVQRSCVMP